MDSVRQDASDYSDKEMSTLGDEPFGYQADPSLASPLDRLLRLQCITAALNEAVTLAQVADVIVTKGMLALGATAGLISLLSEDCSEFYTLAIAGYPPIVQEIWRKFPADAHIPIADAVRARAVLEFKTVDERNRDYGHLTDLLPLGKAGASLAVPILAKPGLVAAIDIFMPSGRRVTLEDRAFIDSLAELSAPALDRARLYEAALYEVSERELVQTALAESEERFRSLVDGAKDYAILMVTINNRVATWNTGAARILGYADHEIIGRSAGILFSNEDQSVGVPEREIEAAIRDGRAEDLRRLVRKDGSEFWCESVMTPLYFETGELRGFEKVMRDITERKRQEDELRHQLSLTEAITNNAAESFFLMDENSRVTYVNPAAERTFGWGRRELLGRVLSDMVRSNSLHGMPDPLLGCPGGDTLWSGVSIQDHEDVFLRKGGSQVEVSCSHVPFVAEGVIKGSVLVVRDISERKRNEQAINDSAERERRFLREVLASVTEGKLHLCDSSADLPSPCPVIGNMIPLTQSGGIRELRRLTEEVCGVQGLPDQRRVDLVIAVGESAMNAVVHAGGGEGRVCAGPDGSVQVWLEDHGRGISVEDLPRATLERGYSTANTLGHGFLLILETVDRIWLRTDSDGTTVVLEQDRTSPLPAWLCAPDM